MRYLFLHPCFQQINTICQTIKTQNSKGIVVKSLSMCYYTFMSFPRKRGRRYRAKSLINSYVFGDFLTNVSSLLQW